MEDQNGTISRISNSGGYSFRMPNPISGIRNFHFSKQEKRFDAIFKKYYRNDESASFSENYDTNDEEIKKNFGILLKFINSFFNECENIEFVNSEYKKALDKIIKDSNIVFASNLKLIDEAVKHLKFLWNAYSDKLKGSANVDNQLDNDLLLTDMNYFCEHMPSIENDLIMFKMRNVEKDIEQYKLTMDHFELKLSLMSCLFHSVNMNSELFNSFQQVYAVLKTEQCNFVHNLEDSTNLIVTKFETSKNVFQNEFTKFDRDLKESYDKLRVLLKEFKDLKGFLDHEARNMNKNLKLVHENSSNQQFLSKVNEIEDNEAKLHIVINKLNYLEEKFDQKMNDSSKIFLPLFVFVLIAFYVLLKF